MSRLIFHSEKVKIKKNDIKECRYLLFLYFRAQFWCNMNEEQVKLLGDFEFRTRQLIDRCNKLKAEIINLKDTIVLKDKEIAEAKEAVQNITSKYDNLKLAKKISINDDESKESKKRLSNLVREIDKCIALLNE